MSSIMATEKETKMLGDKRGMLIHKCAQMLCASCNSMLTGRGIAMFVSIFSNALNEKDLKSVSFYSVLLRVFKIKYKMKALEQNTYG